MTEHDTRWAPTTFPTLNPKRRYSCAKGHSFEVGGAYYSVAVSNDGKQTDYNFCWICLSKWAVARWPLTCEEVEALPSTDQQGGT